MSAYILLCKLQIQFTVGPSFKNRVHWIPYRINADILHEEDEREKKVSTIKQKRILKEWLSR